MIDVPDINFEDDIVTLHIVLCNDVYAKVTGSMNVQNFSKTETGKQKQEVSVADQSLTGESDTRARAC